MLERPINTLILFLTVKYLQHLAYIDQFKRVSDVEKFTKVCINSSV